MMYSGNSARTFKNWRHVMEMIVINTSVGQKTPSEALRLFQEGDLDQGAYSGILSQLAEKAPDLAHEAATFAIGRPDRFREKICKRATEILNGPVGPRMIRSREDFTRIFHGLPLGTKIKMKLKKEAPDKMVTVFGLHDSAMVRIEKTELMYVLAVGQSKQWGQIGNRPVTMTTLVDFKTIENFEVYVRLLAFGVESIEILK